MNTPIKIILKRLKHSLKQLYGEKLIDVILFGSYAKQTAHQDSDIMDTDYNGVDRSGI